MIATILSLIALVLVGIWITLSDLRDILRGADEHPKEQNPAEKNITNEEITAWSDELLEFANKKMQKPEWSEEDIKKIRSEEYTKGFNDAAFGGKLKEWSMEDEDRIRQIERIAQQAGCTQKLQEEIHAWLKSLRPSWKPSEEQMAALEAATVRYQSTGLESLYEELKKL